MLTLKNPVNGIEITPTFKVDTGSDFTVLRLDDLIRLGYNMESLKIYPVHEHRASTVAEENGLILHYIDGVTLELGCVTLYNRRIFFSDQIVRNLLGSDILKYFNIEIDREANLFKARLMNDVISRIESGLEKDIYVLEENIDV